MTMRAPPPTLQAVRGKRRWRGSDVLCNLLQLRILRESWRGWCHYRSGFLPPPGLDTHGAWVEMTPCP